MGAAQIRHVAGEIGVGEFPFAVTESGEIEARHGDALDRERVRDTGCGGNVLGAGETVGENRIGGDRARGLLEKSRQPLAGLVLKLESFLSYFRDCSLVHPFSPCRNRRVAVPVGAAGRELTTKRGHRWSRPDARAENSRMLCFSIGFSSPSPSH